MADYLGIRPASSTVRFSFTSHAASGAPVAPNSAFENADLRIYKDGSATQRSSSAGVTMTSPFDSVTGLHHADIDLSDNTDAGFYAAGSFYEVHLVPDETVDALAVVKVLAYFDIGVPVANVTQFGGSAGTFSGGRPEVNTTHAAGTAWGSGAITAASIAADAITDAKVASDVTIASVTGAVGSVTGAVGSVTGNVSGNVTGSVGSVATGGIASASFAAGAINAAAIAADAITDAKVASDVTIASVTGAVGSVTGAVGSVTGAVGSVTGSVGSVASGGITAASFAANAINAAKLDPDVTTELQAGLATAAALAVVDGIVDDILLDTAEIGTAGAGLTSRASQTSVDDLPTNAELATSQAAADDATLAAIAALNNLSAAQVNSEVDTAIADARLDELLSADSDIDGAAPPTVGSVFHELLTKTAGSFTYDQTTDSLEAVRDNMGTAQTGDSFARLGAPAGASVSADIAAIEAQTDDIGVAGAGLTALGDTRLANLDATVSSRLATAGYTAPPTAAANADAVWDEAIAGHAGAGSTGEALAAAGSAGDPWTTALPGAYSSGQAGKIVGDNLNATVGSRATQTSVDDIPTNAELATSQAAADDATLAAIAALNNLSTAQVNTEVDTALADIHLDHLLATTYDPASKPGAADALLNELVESDAGVARYTANALEQAPTGGAAPTVGAIADAVWDEATAGHTTSGTFGEQAKTDIDAILADTNELQTDWVNGGRLDNILDARSSQASVDTVDGIVDDILLDTAEIGAAGAGLTNINLPNQTMDIVGNITGNLSGSVGSVSGAVGSVTGSVGSVVGAVGSVAGAVGSVTGSVGSVAAGGITSASIATGAIDADALAADAIDEILDETIGDGTLTMRQALRVLVAGMAGKLSGAATTTVTIRNTADSADVIVATVDASGNRSAVTVTP